MATDFFYLLSTLPLLQLNGEGAVDYSAFLASCRRWVSSQEYACLEGLTLAPKADEECAVPVLEAWSHWRTAMDNVVAEWRFRRRGGEGAFPRREEREIFPGDVKALQAVLERPGLLAKQQGWEELAWRRLDELAAGESFNFTALVVYALKLLVLSERRRYDVEAGSAAFEKFVSARLDEAAEHRVLVEE